MTKKTLSPEQKLMKAIYGKPIEEMNDEEKKARLRVLQRQADKATMEEKLITLDLYFENGEYGIYLGDNNGGSGITVTGKTPGEVTRNIAPYIVNYFYENDKEDEE